MENWKAYSFEAKAIQKFVFASGKLRDAIGASALIDALAVPSEVSEGPDVDADRRSLFDHVCAVSGLPFGAGAGGFVLVEDGATRISAGVVRKAGGVVSFVWQTGDDGPNCIDTAFARFRPLWAAAVREAVPGLEFIDGVGAGIDVLSALDAVQHDLGVARNRPVITRPSITPFAAIAPRTGTPAISTKHGVLTDRATIAKAASQWTGADGVAANLLEAPEAWQWPIDLDDQGDGGNDQNENVVAFPFRVRGNGNANRTIGLLHIDGNGLGQSLIALRQTISNQGVRGDAKDVIDRLYRFSLMIQDVTVKAARAAMKTVIDGLVPPAQVKTDDDRPVLPVRPILLGGDDITVLLRADCAMAFARSFISQFEREARLHKDAQDGVAPMTACGGLVFAGASHPFSKLAELAESLCAQAKIVAKARAAKQQESNGARPVPVPGAVSFHRIKTADHGEYDDIIAQELTVPESGAVLTMNPYFIKDTSEQSLAGEAPALDDLEKLGALLSEDGFARGPLRELMTLIYLPPEKARQRYRRWQSVVQNADNGVLWKRYCEALGALYAQGALDAQIRHSLFDLEVARSGVTPLLDALTLEGVKRGQVQGVEAADG